MRSEQRLSASDVIIIGGGIVGASCAYFLRKLGRTVTLVERALVGQQASGVNFGNVRRQGRPYSQLLLANRSIAIWRRIRELTGDDVEYEQTGHLRVCYASHPGLVSELEAYATKARDFGLDLELMDRKTLRLRFPFLGHEVLSGSFSPADGQANPRLVAPAFARAAQRLGAEIFENTKIAHIDKIHEDFLVASDDGRQFRAPTLLVAAGAWSNAFATQFGEDVPMVTRGPTMSVTEPIKHGVLPAVGVYTPVEKETVYFRQIRRGNVIIGGSTRGPAYADTMRAYVRPENTISQLGQISRLAPPLAQLRVIRVWSGIEGYLPDGLPVLGSSRRARGLFYAFGFSGSGFQIGPGAGEAMADLISGGQFSTPIEGCDVGRFAESRSTSSVSDLERSDS